MYEPIGHLVSGEMRMEVENGIVKAVKDMGIVVDKEELVKALQYDRGQYDKGYRDGIKEFAERFTNRICEKLDQSLDNPNGNNYYITDVYTDIDNLVEEMTERKEGVGNEI